jgi:Flp pilus assembly protein TadD
VTAEQHRAQGDAHYVRGEYAQAAASYDLAIRLRPDDADAHNNLGAAIAELGRLHDAIAHYQEALRLRPQFADGYYNLGNALRLLNRNEEAIASYAQSLRLRPAFAEGHNNLGIALRRLNRLTESEISLREAIRLRAGYPIALVNLGLTLAESGRLSEALVLYDEALKLDPQNADAHRNRSLVWLLRGDLARAFPEYAWRWRCADFMPIRLTPPAWNGSPLAGRSILLYTEQGFGDTIMFCRFAREVERIGGVVTLAAPAPLLPLLRTCAGISQLFAREPLPTDCDTHLPLLSVPGVIGTARESIPAEIPYLSAEDHRVERWRGELARIPGFKIGIAWQGNPVIQYDLTRSVPLRAFEPLARVPGVQLISLQKKHGLDQLSGIPFQVLDLGARLDQDGGALLDTAAVMKCVDLVVTCDTVFTHLAGALGVPVWLALPKVPHWCWMLDRDDSPWYPSVRLFRQDLAMDWRAPFARMAEALRDLAAVSCSRSALSERENR